MTRCETGDVLRIVESVIYKLKIKYFVEEKSGVDFGLDFANGLGFLSQSVLAVLTVIERRHKIHGFYLKRNCDG